MKNIIKKYIFMMLSKVNIYPTALTDKRLLTALIHKLHPVDTGNKLVRLGPAGDGGYLVPDDINGIEACFSPGVNTVSGFELDCANLGMHVFMADNSVDMPAASHRNFHFVKKYIGAITGNNYMTMDSWVDSSLAGTNSDLLLQMDIEGYEYESILSMSEKLQNRFRIIVVEFHMLDKLFSHYFYLLASRVFDKLLHTHMCVHIHPNNYKKIFELSGIAVPPMAEFTFLRKDRIKNYSYAHEFPHILDSSNTDNSFYALPSCWYRRHE